MQDKYLRATASTRHTITIAWDSTASLSTETPRQLSEDGRRSGSSLSDRPSPKNIGEDSLQASLDEGGRVRYILQMKDKILGWKTVYSGYRTRVEVKCLKPGECFQFRLKKLSEEEETDWSDSLYAATKDEAIPLGQLLRSVQNGNAISTKKIIAQRPAILNTPNKFSQSPLELAIFNNDLNMVTLLINNGADITRTEIGSWRTPLMIAAFRGHLDILKVLAEKGCSWDDRDRNGMTALHYAAENSHLEIVKFAIEDGADITAKDVFGWSALMRAVTLKASAEVIEYLLDNGGDANEADGRKQTLLMQAVQSGRPEIVKLILSRDGDISRENIYAHRASDFAVASSVKVHRKDGRGPRGRGGKAKKPGKMEEKPAEVKVSQRKRRIFRAIDFFP